MRKTPKNSRILEAVHETARDLHAAGFASKRRMKDYDALCLGSVQEPPSQPGALPRAESVQPVGPQTRSGLGEGPKARAGSAQGNALGWEGGSPPSQDSDAELDESLDVRSSGNSPPLRIC